MPPDCQSRLLLLPWKLLWASAASRALNKKQRWHLKVLTAMCCVFPMAWSQCVLGSGCFTSEATVSVSHCALEESRGWVCLTHRHLSWKWMLLVISANLGDKGKFQDLLGTVTKSITIFFCTKGSWVFLSVFFLWFPKTIIGSYSVIFQIIPDPWRAFKGLV